VYRDESSRTAAMNMAVDEALLERSIRPSIRLYRWDHPAISFGYFGKYADVQALADHCDIVRRWTGGGIVFHGSDLTYSLVIPAQHPAFAESSIWIYERVHRAIQNALARTGQHAELAPASGGYASRRSEAEADGRRKQTSSAVPDRRCSKHECFANPVRADVLVKGRKIAGAAQRRTRGGLLHQGSIQQVELASDFEVHLATELSLDWKGAKIDSKVLDRGREISQCKYSSKRWLFKR
jgi:lipoyl(octanoyl) transferase